MKVAVIGLLLLAGTTARAQYFHWSDSLSGTTAHHTTSIAVDNFGRTVVSGTFQTNVTFPGIGVVNNGGTGLGSYIARYDSNGNVLWVRRIGAASGAQDNIVHDVAVDNNGNIYVAGEMGTAQTFFQGGPTTLDTLYSNASINMFVTKYDSIGNRLWTRGSGGTSFEKAHGVAVDAQYIYLTGIFAETFTYDIYSLANTSTTTKTFILKISLTNGLSGLNTWINKMDGTNDVIAYDIKRDIISPSGAVYIVGRSDNCSIDMYGSGGTGAPVLSRPKIGGEDAWLAKLSVINGFGNDVKIFGDNNNERAYSLVIHNNPPNALIYVTGYYEDSLKSNADTLLSNGQKDLFCAWFDPNTPGFDNVGMLSEGGTGDDEGRSIAIDGSNRIYIGGIFNNTVNFGGAVSRTATSATNPDAVLLKYNLNGGIYWAIQLPNNGPGSVEAVAAKNTRVSITGDYDQAALTTPTFPSYTVNPFTASGKDVFIAHISNVCTDTVLYGNTVLPLTTTLCAGSTGPNLVTDVPPAGGDNTTYNYQWIQSPDGGTNWENAPNGTSATLNTGTVTQDMLYRRLVTSGCSFPDTSNEISVTAKYGVPAWTPPGTICTGDPAINLNTLLDPSQPGNASAVLSSTGVTTPNNILGAFDGSPAVMTNSGDVITVDLGDTVPIGVAYTLRLRQTSGAAGLSQINIEESADNIAYSPNSFVLFTEIETYFVRTIIAETATRYVRLTSNGTSVEIDGIAYDLGATTGGTWSGPQVSGNNLTTATSGLTTVTYTLSTGACVIDSTVATIDILAGAVGGTVTADPDTVCSFPANVTLGLTGNNGTIDWEQSTNGGTTWTSTGLTTANPSVNPTGETHYRVLATVTGCSAAYSDTVKVILDPLDPVINCPANITAYIDAGLCDEVVNYAFAPTDTTDNCTIQSFAQTAGLTSGSSFPLGITTNTFELTDINGNMASCSFTVTIMDTIPPTINNCPANDTSCNNVFTWTTPTGTDCSTPVTVTNLSPFNSGDVFPVGTTEIKYLVEDAEGNGDTCIFSLTVLPTINPVFVLPDTLCLPLATYNLNTGTALNAGETQTFYGTPSVFISGGTDLEPDNTGTGQYDITHVVNNGFCKDSLTLTVDIMPEYLANWVNPDTICATDSIVNLNPFISGTSTMGGYWFGTGVYDDSLWDIYALNGDFDISYAAGIGVCTDTVTQTVHIGGLVDSSWALADTLCSNVMVDLTTLITGTTGGTFTGPGVSGSTFDPSALTQGDYTVTYTVGVPFCSSSLSENVYIRQSPMVDAGADTSICDSVLVLNPTTSGAGTFTWSFPTDISITDPSIANATAVAALEGTYVLHLQVDNLNCSETDSIEIEYFFNPSIVFAGNDTIIDFVSDYPLTGLPPDYGTGTWSTGSSQSFLNINDPQTTVSGLLPGANTLIWTVSNGVCPDQMDTVVITLNELIIPNGFSPNGDETNDRFVINGLPTDLNNQLMVFNRWGNPVYKMDNYDNSWDGTGMKGDDLPTDTYFYVLTIEGSEASTGYIVIKR